MQIHLYWLLHMTVIIYSTLYDTQEGTVGILMLSRLPHCVPVVCLCLYLISLIIFCSIFWKKCEPHVGVVHLEQAHNNTCLLIVKCRLNEASYLHSVVTRADGGRVPGDFCHYFIQTGDQMNYVRSISSSQFKNTLNLKNHKIN